MADTKYTRNWLYVIYTYLENVNEELRYRWGKLFVFALKLFFFFDRNSFLKMVTKQVGVTLLKSLHKAFPLHHPIETFVCIPNMFRSTCKQTVECKAFFYLISLAEIASLSKMLSKLHLLARGIPNVSLLIRFQGLKGSRRWIIVKTLKYHLNVPECICGDWYLSTSWQASK